MLCQLSVVWLLGEDLECFENSPVSLASAQVANLCRLDLCHRGLHLVQEKTVHGDNCPRRVISALDGVTFRKSGLHSVGHGLSADALHGGDVGPVA